MKNQKGQGLVEYLIIVALMGVAAIGVITLLQQTVKGKFTQVTQSLQGTRAGARVEFERVRESHFKKRDFSDFMRGSVNRESREQDQ